MTDEQIITAIDFDDADEAQKTRVIENIRTIVELRVSNIVTELVPEDKKQKFNELMAGDDNDAVWQWLREEVVGVDVSEVYEATLKDYLDEYLANQALLG